MHTRELPGLSVRGATPELCMVRPHQGTSDYIPEDLVAEVQRALDNGREVRELLHEAGDRYVKALKRQRSAAKAG